MNSIEYGFTIKKVRLNPIYDPNLSIFLENILNILNAFFKHDPRKNIGRVTHESITTDDSRFTTHNITLPYNRSMVAHPGMSGLEHTGHGDCRKKASGIFFEKDFA